MKFKTLFSIMTMAALLSIGFTSQAQTNVPAPNQVVVVIPAPATAQTPFTSLSADSISTFLANGIITIGQPATIGGVTGVVNVNSNGIYVITVLGSNVPNGSLTYTPPNTLQGVASEAASMMRANNPDRKST